MLGEGVVGLDDGADRLGEGGEADRRDHEFLEVGSAGGVRAAVEDVGQRHGQRAGSGAAEVAVERLARGGRGGVGGGEGDGEDGVCAEPGLVRRPVELEQDVVDDLLVVGVGFEQVVSDFVVDGLDGVQHAAAAVAVRVAITSFDGFVGARAGAGWDGGAAQRAAREMDIGLDGGIAA